MRRPSTRNRSAGFTIFEITFVIAIFAIMASIVLFRFKDFGTAVTLDNLAQDIALEIVSAQKAAISGAGNINQTTLGFTPNYGVYFTLSSSLMPAASKRFTHFTDVSGDKQYNGSACTATPTAGVECISVTDITTGDYVSNICYNTGGGSLSYPCVNGPLHIDFTRPFPAASLKLCSSGVTCGTPINAETAYIEITSGTTSTLKRTIIVTSLGQVRVYPGPFASSHP